ncbi:Sensory neuron membrane protein 1 [Nesidiocoris tenuis]|uniref:Sensory neuron membrane protein 1 n=1 Tax=Nesidiocoris tenuis TaxID=355587 RepID=A0ABN7ALF3_9HEMI|nr:Sensory neuron membrane protein 1 [Nesidiocoris tenuis]
MPSSSLRTDSKAASEYPRASVAMVSQSKKGSRANSPVFTNFMERMKEMPTKVKQAPPKKFGKVGAAMVVGGVGFGWVVFPYILSFAINQMVHLDPGGEVHDIWKDLPQSLDFSFYIFNVTNPYEVQKGAKPVLQEIGPYRYIEWKKKVDLLDNPDEDEITYSNLNIWYFQPEKSYPLTGDEVVTIPHLPLMSMLLVAETDFPPAMLTLVNAAIPKIYGKMDTVFLQIKVKDFLFDGFPIDCTAKDLIGRTVCVAVKANSRPLVKDGKNKYLFSVLGAKNNTPEYARITVKKGTRSSYDIGKVMKINGKPYNTMWKDECNIFEGTDASIFPPFRTPDNTSIVTYSPDICRSIRGTYEGEGEYNGVRGHKYNVDLGDMKNNPKDACYCVKKCYKKGTVDLTKCQGAPLIGTLPHFYLADESYLDGVVGLRPNKDKHEIIFVMEPITGVPLQARKRFQFNVDMHPIQFVNLTKNLRPTLFPVLWLEESLDLGPEIMGFLQARLLTNLTLVDIVKWSLIVIGSGVGIAGIAKHQMEKNEKKKHERGESVSPAASVANSQRQLIGQSDEFLRSESDYSVKSSEIMMDPSRLKGSGKGVPIVPHPHIPTPPEIQTLERSLFGKLEPESESGIPPVEVTQSRLSAMASGDVMKEKPTEQSKSRPTSDKSGKKK